jgi:hypothetical protein
MIVRPETTEDINAIEQITREAFKDKSFSDGTEHLIINRLRRAQALSLSLVAEIDRQIVNVEQRDVCSKAIRITTNALASKRIRTLCTKKRLHRNISWRSPCTRMFLLARLNFTKRSTPPLKGGQEF